MKALEARALLFQRKITLLNVDFTIPEIPELDDQLAVLELTAADVSQCQKLSKTADGSDQTLAMAASIVKSLVMRENRERVCGDNDVEAVAGWGLSVIKPLSDLVDKVSGLTPTAVVDAKKNSKTTQKNDSDSSSAKN
jgi:hypothetical protein